MLWINFLHFYQPPTISDEIIDEVVKSSYKPWVDFLNKNKDLKITVNFTACLAERLYNSGYQKLLDDFIKIAERGQIEFVETAGFHPILPLLPEKEIIKQIKINNNINKKRFGKVYQPKGFYLPEMAYSKKVAEIINELGYKYIILDEIAFNGLVTQAFRPDNNIKYKIKGTDLCVVFRNREISQTFVPKTLINILEGRSKVSASFRDKAKRDDPRHSAFITATDGELYGHKYWNWWPAYTKALKHLNTETLSKYLSELQEEKEINPVACSWESTQRELEDKIPYAIWQHPNNKVHKLLWRLANFALKLNYKHEDDINHFSSRLHLEKGLASCTFWWASDKDFKMFSPHAWDPKMVEVGAHELLYSIRSLNDIKPRLKLKAEKMFSQIRSLIWKKHWKK